MKKRFSFIGGLVALLLLGLTATSFAGVHADQRNDIGTEAGGDWRFVFDAPETKADIAAQNYSYDDARLARIGTEAGVDWRLDFDAPPTRADIAAQNHDYSIERMSLVGTEAGQQPIGLNLQNSGGIADQVAGENRLLDPACRC